MKMRTPAGFGQVNFARRITISIFCALFVVLIASRVNQPLPEAPPGHAQVGDEVLSEVRLDMRSPKSALESIQRTARAKIIIDDKTMESYNAPELVAPFHWPAIRLRNVRLGSALAIVLEQMTGSGAPEYHEENGAIIIGGAGTALLPVYTRIYDVRDLLHTPMPKQTQAAPMSQQMSVAPERKISDALEHLLQEGIGVGWVNESRSINVWSGRLVVTATETGQRDIQQMLLVLRRCDTVTIPKAKATP